MLRPWMFSVRGISSSQRAPWRFFALASICVVGGIPAGCGTDSLVPPPPPELASLPDPSAVKPSTSIFFVFRKGKVEDRSTIALAARQDAGRSKVSVSVEQISPEETDENLPGLIRSAASRGATVLVVEAVDAPGVAEALSEVRDRGTQVLLLLSNVPSRDPSKPFKRVTFAPFDKPASAMVAATLAEAKQTGNPADGHVLIVSDPKVGPASEALTEAIRSALKTGGMKEISDFQVDNDYEKDKEKLAARLDADKKISIVIATDVPSLNATLPCVESLRANRSITIGGCQSVEAQFNDSMTGGTVGVVERNVPALGRQALRMAVKLANGEAIPDLTEVPVIFQPYNGSTAKMKPTKGEAVPGPNPKDKDDRK